MGAGYPATRGQTPAFRFPTGFDFGEGWVGEGQLGFLKGGKHRLGNRQSAGSGALVTSAARGRDNGLCSGLVGPEGSLPLPAGTFLFPSSSCALLSVMG